MKDDFQRQIMTKY